MIDLDREMRALLEEDVRRTPPLSDSTPTLRRTRRRQAVVGVTGLLAAVAIGLGALAGMSALARLSDQEIPVEPPDALIPDRPPRNIARARDASLVAVDTSTVWVASEAGAWRLDGDIWSSVPDGKDAVRRVRDLAMTPDGTVWAATGSGLERFDGSRWVREAEGEFGALGVAPDGHLWVARAADEGPMPDWTVGRVGDIDLPGVTEVKLDGPRALAVGPGGDVWLGSAGSWLPGGLEHARGGWSRTDQPEISPTHPRVPACSGFSTCDAVSVKDIEITPGGMVWVAFEAYGLGTSKLDPTIAVSRFDGSGWRPYYRDADGDPFAYAWYRGADLDVTPSGRLLLATGDGLMEFRDGAWHVIEEGDFASLDVAPDGSIWVGGDRVYRLGEG